MLAKTKKEKKNGQKKTRSLSSTWAILKTPSTFDANDSITRLFSNNNKNDIRIFSKTKRLRVRLWCFPAAFVFFSTIFHTFFYPNTSQKTNSGRIIPWKCRRFVGVFLWWWKYSFRVNALYRWEALEYVSGVVHPVDWSRKRACVKLDRSVGRSSKTIKWKH